MGRCCSRKAGKCYGELSSKGEGMRWALEHLVGEGGLGPVLGGTGYCGFLGRERSWRMTMTLRAETKHHRSVASLWQQSPASSGWILDGTPEGKWGPVRSRSGSPGSALVALAPPGGLSCLGFCHHHIHTQRVMSDPHGNSSPNWSSPLGGLAAAGLHPRQGKSNPGPSRLCPKPWVPSLSRADFVVPVVGCL